MKVISLSLDPLLFDSTTAPATRVAGYGRYVEQYTVVLPIAEVGKRELAPNVAVYATGGGNKLVRFFKLYALSRKLLREQSYDVLTVQDPYFVGLVGYMVARQFKLGFEIQILGLYHITKVRYAIARWLLPKAHSLRILSKGLKERLLSSEFGMKRSDHMHVVPIYAEVSGLGFDESALDEAEATLFRTKKAEFAATYQGRFNLLTVSRLIPVKNHRLQLQSVADLKAEFPELLLHIVGDGELRDELEAEVVRLGIAEQVVFHGAKYATELGVYFTSCDAFVLSSDSEGWGMVVIEAATAGLPIIMTDVGCAGVVIKDGESGLVVPPRDQAALTATLRRFLLDTELQAKLRHGVVEAIVTIATFDEIARGCVASWQHAAEHKEASN